MLSPRVNPFFILVVCVCPRLFGVNCDTVSSPHIRILDVATKSSETRLIPHRFEYANDFRPKYQQQPNWYEQNRRPLKSYVIYDEYPVKIFKEWKGDADFSVSRPPFLLELSRHPDAELTPDYYLRNRPQVLPPPKPTLAYHSVYSNIIKVFDDSLDDFGSNRFQIDRVPKPYDGGGVWKSFQSPVQYESVYPQEVPRAPYQDEKLPDSFPKIFSPNTNFHFTPFSQEEPKPPKHFYPQRGYYDTHTVNYDEEGKRVNYNPEDAEFLPEIDTNPKNQKVFLCSFIRLNQKQFPESGQPCSRSEDNLPILAPEYPDYSKLPNDKIPVEHRRQHHQMKRIKRSEDRQLRNTRPKRASGLGYSYGTWSSPFGYENSYDGYFSDYYPSRGGYGSFSSNYGKNYYRNNGNRDRYQRYRNRYYSDSRSNYDDYDDEYQNNDDSNSKGLTSYLTSGGRRYKNRKNNDDDDDNDDEDNDNNHDDDSDEEMERQNSGRRGSNDRRNNDDSRDRRRNNNNNNSNNNNNNNNNSNNSNNNNYDDDDSRDSRRNNNNRQNSNSRRNNKRYNDRYDYNNRNRNSYGSNSGYGFNNGYGSSNGGYGNSYGSNGYGTSGGYGNNGYGSNGYGNGYGNGYSSHGGFGYGSGYGNGFSSI